MALASSISGLFTCWYLYRALKSYFGHIDLTQAKKIFFKSLLVGLALGLAARALWFILPFNKYVNFTLLIGADLILFVALGVAFQIKQFDYIVPFIKKR